MKKVRHSYVFRATVWFEDDYIDGMQKWYIVADSEEECEAKLLAYAKQLKRDGFGQLNWIPDCFVVDSYVLL